jgi:predicted metal-dependent peptidase
VHLLWADAEVAGVQTFERGDPVVCTPKGGGGTDFRPVFNWVEAHEDEDIACVIYLTDMYGTFPKEAPAMPVLWVATSDVVGPWGDTIRLEASR